MFTLSSASNNKNLHEAIFSPHLNIKEGNFTEKIGVSSQIINPFINHINSPLHQVEKTEEIGVFGAEKYFNKREVEIPKIATNTKYLPQRDEPFSIETKKFQVEYGTPSISSVSTWNIQSSLLKNDLKNSFKNTKEKVHAKSVLSSFGFKCSCSDKNSVDINDDTSEMSFNNIKCSIYGSVHGKTTPKKKFNLGLDDNLSVKIRKPCSGSKDDVYFQKQENLGMRNHVVKMQIPLDDEKTPRKSLEVFGSPAIRSLKNNKRLIIQKMQEIVDDDGDDDAKSDASSDLFEIESLKGKSSSSNFFTRQTSDAISSCVSPNCYAPSEASVEWSVVTASAAVMSDCEDQMSEFTIRSPIKTPKVTREIQKRRPGILLGCKSHKSVRVVGDAFITYEKQSLSPKIGNRNRNNVVNSQVVARTNLGAKTRHGGKHCYTTSQLQASNSPHASKLFYNYN